MRRDRGPARVERRLLHLFGLGRAHGFHPLQHFGIPAVAFGRRRDDDQVAHHPGMLDGHADRRVASMRVPGDVGLRDLQVPQYRGDVVTVPLVAHRRRPQGRAAVPFEVDGDDLALARQRTDGVRHRGAVPEPARQHHDRLALAVDLVVEAQALGRVRVAGANRRRRLLPSGRSCLDRGREQSERDGGEKWRMDGRVSGRSGHASAPFVADVATVAPPRVRSGARRSSVGAARHRVRVVHDERPLEKRAVSWDFPPVPERVGAGGPAADTGAQSGA